MSAANAYTATWDAENRLSSLTPQGGPALSFQYDFSGRRVRKTTTAGVIRYPFEGYEVDSAGVSTKFIFLGGERAAAKKSTGAKLFYHNDHLGGVNVVTESNGIRVQLSEYDPWSNSSRL